MSTTTIPVTAAKQRFTELVKGVHERFERYIVTKNGTEAAVVMSVEEYEGLLETLDILKNSVEVKAIGVARREARRGRTVSLTKYRSASKGKRAR